MMANDKSKNIKIFSQYLLYIAGDTLDTATYALIGFIEISLMMSIFVIDKKYPKKK